MKMRNLKSDVCEMKRHGLRKATTTPRMRKGGDDVWRKRVEREEGREGRLGWAARVESDAEPRRRDNGRQAISRHTDEEAAGREGGRAAAEERNNGREKGRGSLERGDEGQ